MRAIDNKKRWWVVRKNERKKIDLTAKATTMTIAKYIFYGF